MRRRDAIVALAVGLGWAGYCYGLVMIEKGPDSVRGHPTVAQPDWPAGLVALPRHESRVLSMCGNGADCFYFDAKPAEIYALIRSFAKIRMRDHELIIAKPPKPGQSPAVDTKYNVYLYIPSASWLRAVRADETARTYEPTLTIYVALPDDRALAEGLKVPDNIMVNNQVEGVRVKGTATKPKREDWFARVQFEDSSPATDFAHGVITKVTLWEKDVEDGIPIGRVDGKGVFQAAFSEQEIADLKAGRWWLTLTVGNWLTEPGRDEPKLSWKDLTRDEEKAEAVTIGWPRYFYGRLLYEDGSPVEGSGSWGVRISFPFGGDVRPDEDGYFRVCFTGKQFEQAKAQKSGKNIYVPDVWNPNSGRALYEFPVAVLSPEKEKAGVVKIPRRGADD